MLTEANFNFHDLSDKLNIDVATISANVRGLVEDLIEPKFRKMVFKSQTSI